MVARVPTQQYSFTSGTLDPDMAARGDVRAYYSGAKEILNMLGLPQGGLDLRGGLEMCAELPQAATGCRFTKFEFSTEQAYLTAFTDQQVRIYKDGALQATVATPYTAAQLPSVDWTQSLDTMILVHQDHEYRKLMRQGSHTAWSLQTLSVSNIPTSPFTRVTAGSGDPSATSGTITFTSTADDFSPSDVGKHIWGNGGCGKITAYTNSKSVTLKVKASFASSASIDAGDWTIEEPTWSNSRGWPRSVFLFQGRLYFGGSKSRSQTVWGSSSNDFFDFATTPQALDDEAVELSLDSDRVSAIEQIYAQDSLFLFTSGGIFVVDEAPVTPSNFYALRHSEMPAANLRPVEIEGSIAFVKRGDDGAHMSVHELVYDDVKQGYTTQDLTLLAASLLRNPVEMAMRMGNETNSANHLMVVNGDGTLAVLNTRRSQQITGWTLCDTQGLFKNVAVVGNTPYFLVKRTIAGVDRFFIERMKKNHRLDCSIRQTSGTPKAIWTGLDYLNGHTVHVIGDDAHIGEFTVSGGSVTLDREVSTMEAGLPFNWAVETMPVEAQLTDGTLVGNAHRLTKATVRLRDTQDLTINGHRQSFRHFNTSTFDSLPPAYTGMHTVRLLGWKGGRRGGQGATLRMEGQSTAKATILSVTVEVAQ